MEPRGDDVRRFRDSAIDVLGIGLSFHFSHSLEFFLVEWFFSIETCECPREGIVVKDLIEEISPIDKRHGMYDRSKMFFWCGGPSILCVYMSRFSQSGFSALVIECVYQRGRWQVFLFFDIVDKEVHVADEVPKSVL